MKTMLIAAFALVALGAQAQRPISAYNFDGILDAFVDGNPGYVFPLDFRQNGTPTTSIGAPTYTTEAVGPSTKQVASFGYDTFFRALHGMSANGGGSYLNQYSILLDVKFEHTGTEAWASFFNTTADNQNDGDSFLQWLGSDTNGTFASIGISGIYGGTVYAGVWNRIIIVVDCGYNLGSGTRLTYFLNGQQIHVTEAGSGTDGRWAGYTWDDGDTDGDNIDLLADNDLEQTPGKVSMAAFYDRLLTADEALAFGGPGRFVVPGDANIDGTVDIADYAILSAAYLSSEGEGNFTTQSDFNNDGTVDIADYAILSAYYGS